MAKRKKKFTFFWEEPMEFAERMIENFRDFEPIELKFTFPKFSEFRAAKIIPVNVEETKDSIIVKAELPGFKKDEIELNVTEDRVDISAEKKKEDIEKGKTFYRRESTFQSARRSFTLPVRVDPEKTEAFLEDGILEIRMPKLEKKERKGRKIKIK